MTEREKLTKLLRESNASFEYSSLEEIADYLLENSVTLNRTWTPVDKALPTTDGCFEVTIKGSKGKRRVGIANFNKNANFNKWSCCGNVIAWRERDKPYGY